MDWFLRQTHILFCCEHYSITSQIVLDKLHKGTSDIKESYVAHLLAETVFAPHCWCCLITAMLCKQLRWNTASLAFLQAL